MAPYFDTITSFADVPVTDAGIETLAFLKASEGLAGIFGLYQSKAFDFVKDDLANNIKKVKARYDATPTISGTLQQLVENEQKEKSRPATESLMWLLRGLSFTRQALQKTADNPSDPLKKAFTDGYNDTLYNHHNMFVRPTITVALSFSPSREDFFSKMELNSKDEKFTEWLKALDRDVKIMQAFYKQNKYGEIR